RVSVVTNSLATTDEPLVHFGYARYRTALVDMGVALYELMPRQLQAQADTSHGASVGRLHAKLAVVDGRWLSVGSMNMDRRSAHSNTEMMLIVDSPTLAAQASSLLQSQRMPNAYQLRAQGSGSETRRLEWVAQQGEREVVFAREPALNWGRRLRLSVLSAMVDEELL
ncbi:MAG TPA: phospholipase D-like domain-containing protein, partial [Variovorax sp.]|nr:phospholipase D-like domain-containing protein [Variovorax sp.]